MSRGGGYTVRSKLNQCPFLVRGLGPGLQGTSQIKMLRLKIFVLFSCIQGVGGLAARRFELISSSLQTLQRLYMKICIITVHKRSCRKVMFLHLSVSHSVHMGCVSQHALGQTLPGRYPPGRHLLGRHPPGQTPPCPVHAGIHTPPLPSAFWDTHSLPSACWDTHPFPPGSHCCGRYASYWNAYLFFV